MLLLLQPLHQSLGQACKAPTAPLLHHRGRSQAASDSWCWQEQWWRPWWWWWTCQQLACRQHPTPHLPQVDPPVGPGSCRCVSLHSTAQHTALQGSARYFSFHPACMHPTPAAQNPLAAACTDQTIRTCNICVAAARHPAQHREPVCRVWSVANLHALHCHTRQCGHCCCCKAQDAGGIAVAGVCVGCFRGLRLANQAAAVRPPLVVVRGSNRRGASSRALAAERGQRSVEVECRTCLPPSSKKASKPEARCSSRVPSMQLVGKLRCLLSCFSIAACLQANGADGSRAAEQEQRTCRINTVSVTTMCCNIPGCSGLVSRMAAGLCSRGSL